MGFKMLTKQLACLLNTAWLLGYSEMWSRHDDQSKWYGDTTRRGSTANKSHHWICLYMVQDSLVY